MGYITLNECLACSSPHMREYLNLGEQPLANNFIAQDETFTNYPLSLNFCLECFHSQLSVAVSPDILFRNYLYVSGTTKTLLDYFEWFTKQFINSHGEKLKVIDIASNDGTLLKVIRNQGHFTLGIDPAANLMKLAAENGIATVCDFWPGEVSRFLSNDIDVIIAINVFAHVANPVEFLTMASKLIKKNGKIVIQTSQAMMVRNIEFDTAYHEHLSFFNVSSMKQLASRAGVYLTDVALTPIHGTSYVWTFQIEPAEESVGLLSLEQEEIDSGLLVVDTYKVFRQRAELLVRDVKELIAAAKNEGYEIWGYGAAAKGNTFINFASINLNGIIDDNPLKQGLKSPGGNAKVYPPGHLKSIDNRICFVIPAWNFVEEIVNKIKLFRPESKDKILTYFPSVKYLPIDEFLNN